jgi:hypothetical protein
LVRAGWSLLSFYGLTSNRIFVDPQIDFVIFFFRFSFLKTSSQMTQGNGQKKTNKKTPNKSKVTKRGSRWPLLRSDRALRASLPEGNVKKKRQVTREEQQHRARQRSHQLLLLMVADVIIALPLSSVQGKEVIFGSISFPLASLVCFSQSTRVPFVHPHCFRPCE